MLTLQAYRMIKNRIKIMTQKKSPVLKQRIIDNILSNILRNAWESGHRLPTRVEFEKKFSTTAVTVNRAFEPLIQDGFLKTAGRSGTFVSTNLPHLCNFAVVFTDFSLKSNHEFAYYRALHLAEKQVGNTKEIRLINYKNFTASADNPTYKKLYDDIINHRLAGVFFSHWPEGLNKDPLFSNVEIPIVTIHSKPLPNDIYSINISFKPPWEKTVNYFSSQNCKRMALIGVPFYLPKLEYFQNTCESAGIELLTEHIQFADVANPITSEHCTRLLFSQPPEKRPDCLYIIDDNLIDSAINGISEVLNKKELNSIKIACQVNFPNEMKFKTPVAMFGFDTSVILRNSIELMRNPKLRETAPPFRCASEDGIRCSLP
jgi:DNA-binding transcriptional regulator YhcF (GntR family)/DNA-binding LacI/PurR family transcriptional regulator